jgi:hypothetical protein
MRGSAALLREQTSLSHSRTVLFVKFVNNPRNRQSSQAFYPLSVDAIAGGEQRKLHMYSIRGALLLAVKTILIAHTSIHSHSSQLGLMQVVTSRSSIGHLIGHLFN